LAFYSGKPWVYVINELNGTIETFHYNEDSGILERFQIAETREQGDTRFAGCADIHIHPSGKFLYASNRGEINSIVLFDINPATGLLTRKESFSAGGQTPRNFAISLDGNFLLAANQKSNNICVFRIDPETGKLTATGHSLAVPAPVCLKFIP
jgi:6-phosphogluconolactonase